MPLNLLVSTKIVGQRGSSRTLLRDWRILCLEEDGADISFLDLFNKIMACRFDEHDTIVLPPEFVDQPVTCELAQTMVSSDFQQVPLHVKVFNTMPVFGIYIRFCVCTTEREDPTAKVHTHMPSGTPTSPSLSPSRSLSQVLNIHPHTRTHTSIIKF